MSIPMEEVPARRQLIKPTAEISPSRPQEEVFVSEPRRPQEEVFVSEPRVSIPPEAPEEFLAEKPLIIETTEKQNDMPLPIIGIASAGAGLLAKGVSALFSGEGKARRQARRAARQAARAERRGEVVSAVTSQIFAAPMGPAPIQDVPTGSYEAAPTPARAKRGDGMDIGEMFRKYWWVGLIILFLTGGLDKLLKPKRRAPRRRPAPKVVTRYRTRKPATRRRR